MHLFFYKKNKEKIMFSEFFSVYLDEFDKEYNLISNNNIKNFDGVYEHLFNSIFNYSIRALIRELHIYKNRNLLEGETPEERFISFEKITESSEFIKNFHKKYPVLKNYLEQKIQQTAFYINEITNNFKENKLELENKFKVKFEEILDIDLGKGDVHNGGKTVAIVRFNSGKIVYKPHNLSTDIIFENIINWMNSKNILKCKLNSLKVLNYENYGWQEFINYSECKNYKQIDNYYYRAGCFLAIFYTLGTNDIHFENIIVNGENPYFIDLETLFAINNSGQLDTVLSTGFIPNRFSGSLFDMDLSGLCGNTTKSSKIKNISVVNPKTDEMKIETQSAQIYSNNNLVKLNGKNINIQDYTDYFVDGFKDTIELIIKNKNSYLECIESKLDMNQKFRQVIRFTHVYAKFLVAASHPDYLEDETKHYELFKMLYNGCNNDLDRDRISNEIKNLLVWDIPYYYCYFDSTDLFSNNELICKDFFKSSIKECLYDRIQRLNNNLEKFQIDTIKKSLFTAYTDKFSNKNFDNIKLKQNNKPNKDIIINISNEIASNIFEIENSNKVTFLINTFEEEKVLLSPINFNLYEGGGIIWLFSCLGKIYDDKFYKNISIKLLETSVSTYEYYKTKENIHEERISAFSGIGSLMYLYYNIYKLEKKQEYFLKFKYISKKLLNYNTTYLEISNNSIDYDFLCGISGILVLLCKIYIDNNDEVLERIIDKYSKYLLTYINNNNLNKIGLAHGISGYCFALNMIYLVKKDDSYLKLANELLRKENKIYLTNIEKEEIKASWCNGETGMLLVRHELLKSKFNKNILNNMFDLVQRITKNGFLKMNSMCLCHGIYGNIEVLKKVVSDIDELEKIVEFDDIQNIEKNLINDLNDINLGFKNNFIIDTFMIGSSGIAYAKLRDLYPDLPSILYLDIL